MCENVYCSCKHIKPLTCSCKVLFYLFLKLQFRFISDLFCKKTLKNEKTHCSESFQGTQCAVCNGSTDSTADPWSRMFTISGAKRSPFLPNMLLRAIYTFQYIITTHQIPCYWRVNSHSYAKDIARALLKKELKDKKFILSSVDNLLVHNTEKSINVTQKMRSKL